MIKIYEVMAIERGIPLFFSRHIKRFRQSIKSHLDISETELRNKVLGLLKPELTDTHIYNIQITYNVDINNFYITLKPSRKPTDEEYKAGGRLELYHGERHNPLIKQENPALKHKTEEFCKKKNLYDVLLVNHYNYITEGSRSNFLLIKDDKIFTSHIGDALNGITREVIFEICKQKNIEVIETDITKELLKSANSLIITGTSPEIFPIISCGDITFKRANSVIDTLQKEFKKYKEMDLNEYMELFR